MGGTDAASGLVALAGGEDLLRSLADRSGNCAAGTVAIRLFREIRIGEIAGRGSAGRAEVRRPGEVAAGEHVVEGDRLRVVAGEEQRERDAGEPVVGPERHAGD